MSNPTSFDELWTSLLPIGRDDATGGYRRHAFDRAELACRQWFADAARARELAFDVDGNGNLWAWWGEPAPGGGSGSGGVGSGAVVTGSHLDSVPDGGAYDGPLGVVSAFAALDLLRERGVSPQRPLAVVAFVEEEGSRFGVSCLGSRLLTGGLAGDRARSLTDRAGVTLATALEEAGLDPAGVGRDDKRLGRIGHLVELHVEQGRALADLDAPVGVATGIWPHGRWRLDFTGEANHAGTTRLVDRRDPMLTLANTVLAARKKARLAGAVATIGRVEVTPNGTNAVPSHVAAWLDARAADQATLDTVVGEIERAATERGGRDRVEVTMTGESFSAATEFDHSLRERLASVLDGAPALPTGAGHDAAVLANAGVPTAMLFVRNPTGVSHSPAEHTDQADCLAGVEALADALADLAS